MDTLERINKWLNSMCNGDWEHNTTFRVEMLDSPGWMLTFNYEDIDYEYHIDNKDQYNNDNDWMSIISDGKYLKISGDMSKINQIMEAFEKISILE